MGKNRVLHCVGFMKENKIKHLCVLSLFFILNPFLGADVFEPHELYGTGAGVVMPDDLFSYLRYHQAIQVADLDGNSLQDVIVLADSSDFAPNVTSPNVTRGPIGAPGPFGTAYVGSDLLWYKNNGFGSFFPQPLTVWNAANEQPPGIYNCKTLEVADLDGDGDQDVAVWCNSDGTAPSYALGGGRVSWFENRRINLSPPGPGEFFVDGRPKFIQHDILKMSDGDFVDSGVTYTVRHTRQGTIADMSDPPDGRLDLIVYARAISGNSNLYYFENTGLPGAALFNKNSVHPILLSPGGTFFNEPGAIAVVATDVDGVDGVDLVLGENGGTPTGREVIFLKRVPSGQFQKISLQTNFPLSFSRSLAVDNLFGNPCQEIVAGGINVFGSPISVFSASDAACTSWTKFVLPNTAAINHVWDIRTADVNNDGRKDILAYWPNDAGSPATVTASGKRSVVPLWVNDGPDPTTWRTFNLGENQDPPGAETDNGGGLAVADFDNDGDMDVVRAHVETNLVYFENTWNTERFFHVDATADRAGTKQRVISILSTNPNNSVGRLIGQKVQNK